MGEEGTPKTEMINPALLDGVSANFIVKGPSGVEKAYPMRAMTLTFGRSDQCDIAVKESSMSCRHAEISKILGVSEGTVRSRLFYANRQLQNYLDEFRKNPVG